MKRYPRISLTAALLAGTLLAVFVQGVARAGIEPSPFTPEINQLGATENMLLSASDRIVKVLASPPDDTSASPELEGAVNRLAAIEKKLVLVDGIEGSVVAEVLDSPPSPEQADIVPALAGVQNAADKIVADIAAVMGTDTSPFAPEFVEALLGVQAAAQTISTNTQTYIRQLTTDVECQTIIEPAVCASYSYCLWIPSGEDPELGRCDYDPDYPW